MLASRLSVELARLEHRKLQPPARATHPSRTHNGVQKVKEKKMKSNLKKFAFVPALSLVLAASVASAQDKMPCEGAKLSHKQVKALIVSAKTAEDHNKLACYFRSEARSEISNAKYHEEMAKLYKSPKHCNDFAEASRKAAEADNQLAAEHEKMAAEAK